MFEPKVIDLVVVRGDSPVIPFKIDMLDLAGEIITLTNLYAFLMTVDPSPAPSSVNNNLFQITGVVNPGNIITFQPTVNNTDLTPKVYFYDVQTITPIPSKRTVLKGQFRIDQDITKD